MQATKPSAISRRDILSGLTATGVAAVVDCIGAAAYGKLAKRMYRVGIIKVARGNLHTWHFFQAFHQKVDLHALKASQGKELTELYSRWLRNPDVVGREPPFNDTHITHVYDPDREVAKRFAAVFTGARPVDKVEQMIGEVDAVLLGDDTGDGKDHLDLIGPALEAGLPTYCDKPLADTPGRARELIGLAEKHQAPLMSSSLFRHLGVVQKAARLRQSGAAGPLRWLTVGYSAACIDNFLRIYGIHPIWAVSAIAGPGLEGVSQVRHQGAGLLTITYKDRAPATVWMGGENRGAAHFAKRTERFPLFGQDEGKEPWLARYARTIADFARTIRQMIRTRRSPFSGKELLDVVAATHAAVKSGHEKGRVVSLSEVL
jgi:predicted dehydrogenase